MSNPADPKYQEALHKARTHIVGHEKDARWTAVDKYAESQLHTPSNSANYGAIEYAIKLAEEKGLPAIEVSMMQGKWLQTQCQMIDAKNVLEVGTLGGIGAIWLATSSPDTKVITVEIDPERKAIAEEAIAHANLSDRIEVRLGAGVDVLPQIRQEVESGKLPVFDLVFIDADKPSNLRYYSEAMQMVRPRACIIVDNVVRGGRLADDELAKTDVSVSGARSVIEFVGKDPRIGATTLIQTVGDKSYDGVLISVCR